MSVVKLSQCECGYALIIGRNGAAECTRTLDRFLALYGVRHSNDPRVAT